MHQASRSSGCRIVAVGKRRDGGTRYWCLEHHADATAKYGRRAKLCRHAHIAPVSEADIFKLDLEKYEGGVALWGAVPPVYDTTRHPLDRGVHVHARCSADGNKVIDATYRGVHLLRNGEVFSISELDAIYFAASTIFGFETRYVECTYCGHPHLDKDWFSVHTHRRHLCAGCGKHFRDTEIAVGNPLAKVREAFGSNRKIARARARLKIRQADFLGGIQVWASNPAIVWTSQRAELVGIHVHAFDAQSSRPIIDDTFGSVTIDGHTLDHGAIRALMAQNVLPHIKGRVVSMSCLSCAENHFDEGCSAFTPLAQHKCRRCGSALVSRGRFRKVIANPMVDTLNRIEQFAPRKRQSVDLGLLPETI